MILASIPISRDLVLSGPMNKQEVRLGIIGLGNMGNQHARWIREGKVPGLHLAAVCDWNPEKLKSFSEIKAFADASTMIHSGAIDAVLIATPHYDHTPLGIEALTAGLHTLVEKPISVHKADCERLIAAHTNANVVFAAMFNQRTDPYYRKLKQLIDGNELGAIQRIHWTMTRWYRTDYYYSSGGWRATWGGEGGGVLLNQCPHQLDLWQWLFGMPERVRAFVDFGRFHPIEVEDAVTAVLEYKSGATGTFITTTGEAPGLNRLEVVGERGLVIIEPDSFHFIRNEETTVTHLKTCKEAFDRPDVWNISIPIKGHGEQHVGILKNFADAILTGKPLIAPAAEGIHSVELGNAMLFSGTHHETITLPLDAPAYERWLKEKIASSTFNASDLKFEAGTKDFLSSFPS